MAKANREIVSSKNDRDTHAKENNLKDSNIPNRIPPSTLDKLVKDGSSVAGSATIYKGDKIDKTFDVVMVNGTNYDKSTGKKVLDYSGSSGGSSYSNNSIKDVEYGIKNNKGDLIIRLEGDKPPASVPSYTPLPPSPPPRPSPPSLKHHSTPKPTFSSNLDTVKKYEYFFGIDKLKLQQMNINQESCFVTREIEVSSDCEYIKLDCDYTTNEYSNIEFYIIYNDVEYPIVPVKDDSIKNEKLFYMKPTRFKPDAGKSFVVTEDGKITGVKIDDFNTKQKEWAVVSYTPEDINRSKRVDISNTDNSQSSLNHRVKIKAVLRLYNKFEAPPRIFNMKIQEYGGSSLWKDSI